MRRAVRMKHRAVMAHPGALRRLRVHVTERASAGTVFVAGIVFGACMVMTLPGVMMTMPAMSMPVVRGMIRIVVVILVIVIMPAATGTPLVAIAFALVGLLAVLGMMAFAVLGLPAMFAFVVVALRALRFALAAFGLCFLLLVALLVFAVNQFDLQLALIACLHLRGQPLATQLGQELGDMLIADLRGRLFGARRFVARRIRDEHAAFEDAGPGDLHQLEDFFGLLRGQRRERVGTCLGAIVPRRRAGFAANPFDQHGRQRDRQRYGFARRRSASIGAPPRRGFRRAGRLTGEQGWRPGANDQQRHHERRPT
ncbi:MAG: hypothetical protein K1X74_18050 [Pirellulales bacterium]|nr:hypothetical protein [Pirellulales bacterium]